MGWLKRDFCKEAYGAIGLAEEFDVDPGLQQRGVRTLDSMMADWNGDGIRLSYPIPATADGGALDEETGVPDRANLTVWTNLALLLASSLGREVSSTLQRTAAKGYSKLLARGRGSPPRVQMSRGFPAGAGHRRRIALEPPEATLDVGDDGELDFEVTEE